MTRYFGPSEGFIANRPGISRRRNHTKPGGRFANSSDFRPARFLPCAGSGCPSTAPPSQGKTSFHSSDVKENPQLLDTTGRATGPSAKKSQTSPRAKPPVVAASPTPPQPPLSVREFTFPASHLFALFGVTAFIGEGLAGKPARKKNPQTSQRSTLLNPPNPHELPRNSASKNDLPRILPRLESPA